MPEKEIIIKDILLFFLSLKEIIIKDILLFFLSLKENPLLFS
jgi:hypothetical protein